MNTNEFDELLKSTFDQSDFAYNPEKWNRLSRQLDVIEKKKPRIALLWLPLVGVAASLTVFAAVWLPALKSGRNSNMQHTVAQRSVTKAVPLQTPAPQQQPPINNITNSQPIAAANIAAASRVINRQVASKAASRQVVAVEFPINTSDENLLQPITAPKKGTQSSKTLMYENKPLAYNDDLELLHESTNKTPKREVYDMSSEPGRLPIKTTSISIAGGINYCSSNTGVTVGANAHKKLSDKFYLEGDVAYVSNTNTQKTTIMPSASFSSPSYSTPGTDNIIASSLQNNLVAGPPPQPMALVINKDGGSNKPPLGAGLRTTGSSGSPNSGSTVSGIPTGTISNAHPTSSPIIRQNIYKYSYMQLAPVVGYNIQKHISVGVGADVQQLLLDNQPEDVPVSNDIKTVPNMDLGLIGKTEYAISPTVKAGVLYRGDVNNLLMNNSKYVNRSYIQFQLKFAIINK